MNILIRNCMIVPMTGEKKKQCFTGSIGISGNRIAFVADQDEAAQAESDFRTACRGDFCELDGRGKLAMPGLINTHNHVSMTLMRSYADDIPLMRWLNEFVWPFESKLSGDDIRLGAQVGIAEMLLGGTTTFVDMYWNERDVAEAVLQSGIRAVLSPTFTDDRFEDFKEDFAVVAERYGRGQHSRITLMIAPHSVYTCSREHLLEAGRLADEHGIGLNIHISETQDEQHTIRERHQTTPLQYFESLGLLKSNSLIVHAVHIDERDIELIAASGASVAYNPQSNMKISSGVAPMAEMIERGINVSIGTDGCSSNNDLDMWEEFRTGAFLQKLASEDPLVFPAYKTLEMATAGGAKAIGMEDRLGRLAEGMLADIILVDIEKPHFYPRNDMVANLAYCGKSSDVDTVIIDGEIVVSGRKVLNMDVTGICRRTQERVEKIKERAAEDI